MCRQCDYNHLLKQAGLETTEHRLRVLEVIGDNDYPLSAREIHETIQQNQTINRVTIYRILDTLVGKGLVDRLSSGNRAFFYGLAPNEHHAPHPHFFCRRCGRMDCLRPETIVMDMAALKQAYPGRIENVEVRVDGICKKCMQAS